MADGEPAVGVVIGSRTDEPLIQPTLEVLDSYGISHEFAVISAHRNPDRLVEYGKAARERGMKVLIAGAGGAAALPGALAALTTLPVIGVPLPTSEMKGVDSMHAIVQMPPGIPVACVAIGSWGARNAAHLAAEIIGLSDPAVAKAVEAYRESLQQG